MFYFKKKNVYFVYGNYENKPFLKKIIKAKKKDLNFLYKLRNSRSVRSFFTNSKKINYQSHSNWFQKTFKDKNIKIFVAALKNTNKRIGYCRFCIRSIFLE